MLTPLTKNVTGPLKALVVLTSFRAKTPVEGVDTTIWVAASPELDGLTGRFWNKRREVRCRFRDPAKLEQLCALVQHQLAHAGASTDSELSTAR